MDVVTPYLYGSLDAKIYMKVPKGITIPKPAQRNMHSVKLQRSLYDLKQSERMWYNRFSDFLEKKGLLKNEAPVYTKIRERILYSIDDLNVIGTTKLKTSKKQVLT